MQRSTSSFTLSGARARISVFGLVGLLCSTSGCVERVLQVRTDPIGARVYVDGHPIGTGPATFRFDHYGTHELLVRLESVGDGPRYRSQVALVTVSPPWYQYFPFDLFVEQLLPFTITDTHEVTIALTSFDPNDPAERAALEKAATEHGVEFTPQPTTPSSDQR
ncbi:MAG: PEGA domain-containing protein [Planctomycetota bacterium]